jgi:DNA ligase (NAD+)
MSRGQLIELKNQILKARQAYYYTAQPRLSDAAYDALEEQLRALAPDDPLLQQVGAPLPPDSILTKARHAIPMGSQNKVNTKEEFTAWYLKSAAGGAVHASLKGDGASAAAYYEAGQLKRVISRGDGVEGEDISANAAKFKGLPLWAQDSQGGLFSGAVRVEVILTVEDWALVDPERSKNPRNAGNGIMGRKTGEQAELLSSFAFDLDELTVEGRRVFATEQAKLERLQELGFQVIEHRLCQSPEQGIAYFTEVTQTRDELPFWIDGVVFKVNDLRAQEALGSTGNRPKGQVAWKFDSKGAETTLRSYSVSVGHTGALIPTAQLAPVEIGGTTVSSALLNNWDEIERLGVAVGDRVWVIKANDIIPKIVGVREHAAGRQTIEVPKVCPACSTLVRRRLNIGGSEGVIIECPSDDCPAKAIGKLKRWIHNLDIQGIGDSVRLALVDQLGMEDASGLYSLRDNPERLAQLVINPEKDLKLGEKRATTILQQIEKTRRLTLVQFLGSLGIERLASRRVELILQQARGELDTLADWQSGKLRDPDFAARVGVPSLGALIQDSLDAQAGVIARLLSAGVEITGSGVAEPAANAAQGLKTLCISGKLPSGKKKGDYAEPLEAIGYRLVDTVTKGLDILVVGDPDSSSGKAEKARKLGVRVLPEADLIAMLAPPVSSSL